MKTIPLRAAVECTTLLGECTELWDDPEAWQNHLSDGAERLIGGCTTAFKVLRLEEGEPVFDEAMLSPQSDLQMRAQFAQCLADGAHRDMPALATLMPFAFRTGEVSFRYSDLTGGLRAFHDSHFYDRYLRCLRVGDALAANNVQPTGHVVSVWVMRERHERPFSEGEESTLAFLNALLSRLVGTRLATRSQAARPKLSPRLRQTLDALLQGDGEKQIAALFGLQRSTVHGYVRELYRHYGVRSRAELMARFVKRERALTSPHSRRLTP
jgi:DNA-binding CsgD family transcriptional regulator